MKLKLPKLKRQPTVNVTKEGAATVKGVKVVTDKPPVYDSVCQFLGYKDVNAFFAYGDVIYNPSNLPIPDDIVVHEKVHMKQQKADGMTPELWWGKYLRDDKFRIDQEAKAYGAQMRYLKTIYKNREKQNELLHNLGAILSGPLYKHAIDRGMAVLLIKQYSK